VVQGHRLIFPEGIAAAEQLPLLVVGTGKTLKLCNVTIVHAESLAACLQLAPGARLVADSEDNVTKMEGPDPELAKDMGNQVPPLTPQPTTTIPHPDLTCGLLYIDHKCPNSCPHALAWWRIQVAML
jgi:hypothetical protein